MNDPQVDEAAIHAFFSEVGGTIDRIMEAAALRVEAAAKTLVLTSGGGRIYTTWFFTDKLGRVHPYGKRPPHEAGAPGGPPHSDTGNWIAQLHHTTYISADGVSKRVIAGANYSRYLEDGTSRMEPRPVMRQALAIGVAAT
jgi:hypothetical protein